MIDTHCHLTYAGLYERLPAVFANAAAAGVDRMVSVGTSPEDAAKSVQFAHEHPNVFATVGLHPHHAAEYTDLTSLSNSLRQLAADPKVVALGEMGLDLHYPDPPLELQRRAFLCQLDLARELEVPSASQQYPLPRSLPIIIHNRQATDQTIAILRDSALPADRFVFHCFSGSGSELDAILDFGALVGFTGIVTFKNAKELAGSAARVPLDRLLIETDSPYLTPEPYRKIKTNEPCYVAAVARFLAEQRGMPLGDFVDRVDANAARFFRLPQP